VLVLVVVEARLFAHTNDPSGLLALGAAALSALALLGLTLYQVEVAEEAEARTQQGQRLQQAERFATMGQLASAVAHDFNNMVAAVKAISEELQARNTAPAEAAELVSISGRAAALCGQLLALGRSGARGPEPVELAGLATSLEPLLRRLLPRTMRLELEAQVPVQALCDRGQLELALLNLVVNARDAVSEDGLIAVRIGELEVAAGSPLCARGVQPGHYGRIVVEDDGKGMDAATQARVFEPFFTTKGLRGTGLGLPLVAEVVRSAGGQVLLDSAPGQGTRFTLLLREA
jgi:signal transduction histidine kinase